MDSLELYDIRRRLHDWRNHSPQVIYSLLDLIISKNVDNAAILQSKIYKTIKALSDIDLGKEKHKPSLFCWNDYARCVEKAKLVYRKIENNMKQQSSPIAKSSSSNQNTMIIEGRPAKKIEKFNLFNGFKETYSGYIERLPFLNAIGNLFIQNLKFNAKIDIFNDQDKIKQCVIGLEKEIYQKNLFKDSRKLEYELDIKTLLQFLKRDKNGSVTLRVYKGLFSFVNAAKLKAEDWIDDEKKKEQLKAQQEKLESEQIGFYKDLQKREMEDVEGKLCKGCKQKTVHLVGEMQTRCSDEPTTKFFECLNCGDKYRI